MLKGITVEQADERLDEFAAKWDGTYPTISQMWRRNWEYLTPFFAYPADIRKVIYTTNALESLNMSLRKVQKWTPVGLPVPPGIVDWLYVFEGFWSGCRDLNPGPLAPQAKNINHLQSTLNDNTRLKYSRFGRQMDAKTQRDRKSTRLNSSHT